MKTEDVKNVTDRYGQLMSEIERTIMVITKMRKSACSQTNYELAVQVPPLFVS